MPHAVAQAAGSLSPLLGSLAENSQVLHPDHDVHHSRSAPPAYDDDEALTPVSALAAILPQHGMSRCSAEPTPVAQQLPLAGNAAAPVALAPAGSPVAGGGDSPAPTPGRPAAGAHPMDLFHSSYRLSSTTLLLHGTTLEQLSC